MSLNIEPISTRSVRKSFLNLPATLYRDDPNWVRPLILDRKQQISPKQAFFQHASWQGWVAFRDGRPVGRISAQIDHLNEACGRPELGYFGMLEAIDNQEIIQKLFDTAEAWLTTRGKSHVVGPFNLNINQEVGMLVEGFDTPPYFMMGHAKPYYDAQIRAAGYDPTMDLLAYQVPPDFKAPGVMNALLKRFSKRISLRPLDSKNVDRDLCILCDLFNDAWANNWYFVPFTEKEFIAIGKEMLLVIDPDFIQIASVDGEPAAFIVALPNINEAIADLNGHLFPFGFAKLLWRLKVHYPTTARVPLMGVRQKFQHTRLGPTLSFAVIDTVRKPMIEKGITKVELSWILEDNAGMRNIIESIGGAISKRYRMYEKHLS